MATDVSALSTYANVTREAFRKNVEYAGNKSYWLFNNLKLDPQKHAGESLVYVPLQTQLPESATFSAEAAADPNAIQPAFVKGSLYIKKLLAIMKYNEEIVQLNRGEEAIIKDLLNLRLGTKAVYDLTREFSLHTPGNGVLGQATGAASGHTITVGSARWFRVGMVIDGYHAASQDLNSAAITNVDLSANTITVTDPAGDIASVNSDTKFFIEDTFVNGAAISATRFTNGIETICKDTDPDYGDFMGLDRDTYAYAKATVKYGAVPATNEAFTLERLYELLDLLDVNVGPEYMPTFGYCDNSVYRAIYNCFRDEQQPTVFMPEKDGIPSSLGFQYGTKMIKIYKSRFAAPNTLYIPNTSHIIKYTGGAEGWDNYAGAIQKYVGYQQFYETYRGWINYGTDFPQSNGALFDITGA